MRICQVKFSDFEERMKNEAGAARRMMLLASLAMMRCLPSPVPKAHIIAEGNIMCEAHIICPQGQTSCKKRSTLSRASFLGAGEGNRTPESGLGSRNSTIEQHPQRGMRSTVAYYTPKISFRQGVNAKFIYSSYSFDRAVQNSVMTYSVTKTAAQAAIATLVRPLLK